MQASLKAVGNVPVVSKELMMWVRPGTTAGEMAWRRWVGMGSSGQVVGWLEPMTLETSSSDRGEKAGSTHVSGMWAGSMGGGVENWLLMAVVFFTKNDAKSSAVNSDEGVGAGGQRRAEKVFKSVRESGELLIFEWL